MLDLQQIFDRESVVCQRRVQDELEGLLEESRQALKQDPHDPSLYIRLAKYLRALRQHAVALHVLNEGIDCCAPYPKLYYAYVHTLSKLNRTQEAIAAAQRALQIFPDDVRLKMQELLLLPILYQSRDEIDYYRRRFSQGLAKLVADISLQTSTACQKALGAIAAHVNFYLAYQGCDDLQLQQQYGTFVHRIVAACFPSWAVQVAMPEIDGRMRIGYVSAFFRNHSVSKTHLGWLREQNRSEFDVYAYYVGEKIDAITNEVSHCTTRFQHLPSSVRDACQAIRYDNLHLIVFLDIGMDPIMTQLAALRLAPIQCTTWGHPLTSGLPTVDYYLSSEFMEPANGKNHYSERLIPLPGVGVCYRKPVIPKVLLRKTRPDYGLREDAVVYLCCQSVFKYLPDHDDVFSAIAKRVPESQFLFLTPNEYIATDLRQRLRRAFSAVGLSADRHCVLLPGQAMFDYWNLNLIADVFLDTMEWSGCNTTFEAIACGLPVVTLPGRFMRGRHSYAILTQLGVTETIACDKADYVEIAVRLAENRQWRAGVVQRAVDGYSRLYSDVNCVSALEEFYRQAVAEHLCGQVVGIHS